MTSLMENLLSSIGLLFCAVLVAGNAYFVATEFALVAVRRSQVKLWLREGRRGAQSVAKAIEDLDGAIAATQLGITLMSIGLGWVGERSLATILYPALAAVGVESAVIAHSIATVLAFSVITFAHVVAGELAPKSVALDRPGEIALLVAGPLLVFVRIFRPLLFAMNRTGIGLVRLCGIRPAEHTTHVPSPSELSLMVSEASEAGMIRAYTGRILGNVFRISRTCVKDVMVPRKQVYAVQESIEHAALMQQVRENAFTRMPVYRGDLDQIVGILHTKDLLARAIEHGEFRVTEAMREPLFLLPELPIVDALRLFRGRRSHMAIVRKENSVLGIVTLEDVLEEFVGEIEDEHDIPTPEGAV